MRTRWSTTSARSGGSSGRAALVSLMMAAVLGAASCATAASPAASPGSSPAATPAATTRATPRPAATPPAPTLTLTPSATSVSTCAKDPALEAFAVGLMADLASRDARRMAARMSGTFDIVVAKTDVALPPMTPAAAVRALLDGLGEPFAGYHPLPTGAVIACVRSVTAETFSPGNEILKGLYEATFLTSGWGADGRDEAFIYVAHQTNGGPIWRGVWYALAGFGQL